MQWLIDIIKEWIIAQGYLTHGFVDRGDPAVVDWFPLSFATDGAWHDLDLSAIVPAGAKAVLFQLNLRDNVVGSFFYCRTKTNRKLRNVSRTKTILANIFRRRQIIVAPNVARVIEYQATNTGTLSIDMTVAGWWL